MSFEFDDDDDWQAPELTAEDVSEDPIRLNDPADSVEPQAPRARRPRRQRVAPEQGALRFDDPEDEAEEPLEADAEFDEPAREIDEAGHEDTDGDDEDAADAGAAGELEPEFSLGEVPVRPRTPQAERTGGISVRSVFVFLTVVVCGYGALTWSLLDDPDWASRLTRSLPLIGSSLRDASTGSDIALVDVQGSYERTKDGKVVFVITGKAVNQSSETLRAVQIVSTLEDAGERQLDRQVTACGNAMEARIRELSIHQVGILRSIKPPPDLGMQPGGHCPFVSIFLDVPDGAATFSTEVVRAQRYA